MVPHVLRDGVLVKENQNIPCSLIGIELFKIYIIIVKWSCERKPTIFQNIFEIKLLDNFNVIFARRDMRCIEMAFICPQTENSLFITKESSLIFLPNHDKNECSVVFSGSNFKYGIVFVFQHLNIKAL